LKRRLKREARNGLLKGEKIGTMKGLLWASLIIVIIIAIMELFWLGKSELAWVILGLAVAMGLQAVYLIRKK
jgi:hypothetical protein